VQPEVSIFGLDIQLFGLMFGLGFIAAGAVLARRLRELGKPTDWASEMAFAGLAGGLAGAKLWYAVDEGDAGSLFSGAGLTWYGGAIGGAIAVCAWAAWRRFLDLRLFDLAAPALMLGYAIGRVGCQLSGDGDYGVESGLPWAMAFPDGTEPTTEEVHPAPIYETLGTGFAAYALWALRDRLPAGGLFALYLLLAGLERFLVEFIRLNEPSFAGLTTAQVVSVPMMLAGLVWLLALRGRPPAAVAAT
jgi:phosphatidylglycerol---prolipoprotein diacylglyceryl transferase